MKKKIICMILLICLMFCLTGCWDSVELNDRHVVLEIALDKAINVDSKIGEGDYYEITYTIPDVKKLSGKESLSEDVKTEMTTISPTLMKSIDEMETKLQNTLTFSHVKAVFIGEELLKDRQLFENAMDSLSRNMEFSRGTNILAVRGKASEITKGDNYQNPILGLYIMQYFNNKAKTQGGVIQKNLGKMLRDIHETGVTTLPIISQSDEKSVEINGAAIIKDYQLVDWLSADEVKGLNILQGDIEGMPIVIEYKGDYLTYTVEDKKKKIEVRDNQGIEVKINLLIRGDITEGISATNTQIFNKRDIQEIEKLLTNEINKRINMTLKKEKLTDTDFMAINLEIYRKNYSLWERSKTSDSISDKKIYLNTDVVIENTGIIE